MVLISILIVAVLFGYLVATSFVQVKESEIVVITQFGKPVREITESGLALKLPDPIQTATSLEKRLQALDSNMTEYLTQDKKNLVVSSFIIWKIADATRFLRTVKDKRSAEMRLTDLVASELGVMIGSYPLSSFLTMKEKEMKIPELMGKVASECRERASSQFGIELVDVALRKLIFPTQNLRSVYDRMRSERDRIAEKYRAEGKEEATKIRAETDKQVRELLAEAYRDAQVTMGEGEAKSIQIYASAFQKDPQFYKLTRTLEAYKKFLDEQTTLILSTDSQLLQYIQKAPEVR